jgi:hypothetical protein
MINLQSCINCAPTRQYGHLDYVGQTKRPCKAKLRNEASAQDFARDTFGGTHCPALEQWVTAGELCASNRQLQRRGGKSMIRNFNKYENIIHNAAGIDSP